ncbi:MAG: hypothetical protein K9G36_08870 [Crocinitomicaceae bacterium]|jgi:hypothetical protein|nr:hypothetical protein [Crocinitomicaceae bacterium]MCF8410869.1 hypothetical protein [Crocinitomicaceae bacterium]
MNKIIFFSALFIVATVAVSGCRKKKDTIANVYVKDDNNILVDQAMVVLYGTNTAGTPQQVAVFDTSYTNVEGMATFNYNDIYQLGQAGVAVLDIKAQKLNKIGQGIIKIEAETTNEETVFIQP